MHYTCVSPASLAGCVGKGWLKERFTHWSGWFPYIECNQCVLLTKQIYTNCFICKVRDSMHSRNPHLIIRLLPWAVLLVVQFTFTRTTGCIITCWLFAGGTAQRERQSIEPFCPPVAYLTARVEDTPWVTTIVRLPWPRRSRHSSSTTGTGKLLLIEVSIN